MREQRTCVTEGWRDKARHFVQSSFWLPCLLLLCILPLCFLGFGIDNDTYSVIEAGISTWHSHVPATSRHPGYWMYEAIIYCLNTLGGPLLCNLGSFAMAALVIWRFRALALRLRITNISLMSACLVVTPGFIIAASSTDDYLWSLALMVFDMESILADRLIAAAVLSALAIAVRGGNGPVVAGGFTAAIVFEVAWQRRFTAKAAMLAASGVVSALLAAIAYVPSYRLAGNSMSFVRALNGPPELYAPLVRIGKFFYKGSITLGPLAVLVILVAAVAYLMRQRSLRDITDAFLESRTATLCLGYLLGNIVLFFVYPIEFYYLIPATFFFLLLAGATVFRQSRSLTVLLLFSILSFDFVWPIFVRPNIPGRSTGGYLSFGIAPGIIVQDTREKIKLMHCRRGDCFGDYWLQERR